MGLMTTIMPQRGKGEASADSGADKADYRRAPDETAASHDKAHGT